MVKPPLSRKRQRTRRALVESALAVIAEKGFAGASLDEVAAHAGVTKGAIYSNFRSKAELLWAAAQSRSLRLAPQAPPGAPPAEQARAIARALMPLMPQAEQARRFHRDLQLYIASDPELRARQTAEYAALFDAIAAQLQAAYGERLRMPARSLALAGQALAWGFMNQWAQTPDEITEDVIAAAYEALALGATAPR
jgi:AcrR family transcriptional regulator